ncbi:hypothetical protein H2200_011734 [Cladophialophora chaetospira]|uniref:N-acetyltransferase domain-containing protein n=1 Tax=Cladophialophora chaetospira TaxID=386627 RepID=A0AA39CCS6_9EURO|nr:hypothetical protein H2200_011734 [Cladophialophora chaetospira]
MPLRLATFSDLGRISEIAAASFYDEELNDHIFPFRKQYPGDYVSVWHQKVVKSWSSFHKVWVVSYEEASAGKSGAVITGVAEWGREGKGADRLWGIVRWWDPRRLLAPFVSFFYTVHRFLFRNRSIAPSTPSNPNPLNKWNFGDRVEPYMNLFLTHPPYRLNRWELLTLAVDPAYQRRGIGQKLVAWGLDKAKAEGVPAVVIGAKDTEPFYHRCGFVHLVGNVSTAEIEDNDDCVKAKRIDKTNPLKAAGIVGGSVMWTE